MPRTWMQTPELGGFLSPSNAMASRAAAQAAAEQELARLKAITAANNELLARKAMADNDNAAQSQRLGMELQSRQALQDSGNAADLQRLLAQLSSNQAMQTERLSSEASLQNMRGQQNQSLQEMQNRFSDSRDAKQFDRLMSELAAKHRYGQENTQLGHELGLQRDAIQNEYSLGRMGAQAQIEDLLGMSSDLRQEQIRERGAQRDFTRELQGKSIERGYSAKDRELQILEAQDSDLSQRLSQLHQMSGNMDSAGQQKYQDIAGRAQKIDEEFWKQKRITRPEYLQARAALAAEVRGTPWNQYQTSRAGSIRRQGIFDYQLGEDGTWSKIGVSESASPEEIKKYVGSYMGVGPDGQTAWTLDPVKGTINVIQPRSSGARAGSGSPASGSARGNSLSLGDFTAMRKEAIEAVRQRAYAEASKLDKNLLPDQVQVDPKAVETELQSMYRSYQSMSSGQPTSSPQEQPGSPSQSSNATPRLQMLIETASKNGVDPDTLQGAISLLDQVEKQFGRVSIDKLPPELQDKVGFALQIAQQAMGSAAPASQTQAQAAPAASPQNAQSPASQPAQRTTGTTVPTRVDAERMAWANRVMSVLKQNNVTSLDQIRDPNMRAAAEEAQRILRQVGSP